MCFVSALRAATNSSHYSAWVFYGHCSLYIMPWQRALWSAMMKMYLSLRGNHDVSWNGLHSDLGGIVLNQETLHV